MTQQSPTSGRPPETAAEAFRIVSHPAFRLGFLDAQHGRPFDHEDIVGRIERETPKLALRDRRLAWWTYWLAHDLPQAVEVAQYRYEEGRMLVTEFGLRCKAWSDPRYLPAQVRQACILSSQEGHLA